MPLTGSFAAYAAPEPQSQSQGVQTITGKVLDENNEPAIGASVYEKGAKSNAAATNFDGNFTLRVRPGATLVVTYVGYKTVEIAASQGMTVYLQPTTEMLNELVAVGYGTQKRANLTGAVATVDVARVMDSRPTTDVTKALQGSVPGLTITSGDGGINSAATIKIRGTGTLSNNQTSNPLIVVDGVPVDDLSFVNPDDIADISVLKDAASSAIYGTRAAFGVILITTKAPSTQDRVSVSYSNNFGWSQATVLPDFSNVPAQLRAQIQATDRDKNEAGFFGMWFADVLPLAEKWYEQNGGKKAGHRLMQPYVDENNVGDYYWNGTANVYYADWDVFGILYNNAAPSQKHNVSLEGTSGKTQYRLSFGYDSKQDLMKYNPDKLKRYTANVNISTEIFSWLKAGVRFNYGQREFNTHYFPSRGRYNTMLRWGSYWTVLGTREAEDGEIYEYSTIASRQQAGKDNNKTTDTKIQAWMEANIIDGLSLHADFTYDVQAYNRERAYMPVYSWDTWGYITREYPLGYNVARQSNTEAYQYNTQSWMWNTNVYATYAKTFAKDHNLKVMVGGTAEKFDSNYFWVGRDVLIDNEKPYLALTTGGEDGNAVYLGNEMNHRATAGFFGRLNYDYKGIYLLEGNLRYDGSSRFPAGDQWAWFPSVSAGYRFSEEAYFKEAKKYVSNAKLRASYGHIGNEAVGDNMFLSTIANYTSGNVNWLNGGSKVGMMSSPTLVSNSLTWERVITTDIGIDLGFLNNSLNLTFDWFQRDTKDMLARLNELPGTLGSASPYGNAGQLRTRGWELGLGWNHSFGDWDVYANFNIYDGKTKVVKYPSSNQLLNAFYSGQNYGDIWGFETDRYFEESDFVGKDADGNWIYAEGVADQTALTNDNFMFGPGDIKFKDLNGDGKINGGDPNMVDPKTGEKIPVGSARNHGDYKVIGNALPRYEYSFRLGGAWKGFDLDMFFQGVGKRHMWMSSGFVVPFANNDDVIYANQMSYNKIVYDASGNVTGYEIDQSNDYPCQFGSNAGAGTAAAPNLETGRHNFYPQSRYLMNMAYLRFKTLTFGYTLPANITRKALIQKARVYFSADNLCFLYNGMKDYPLDPEIGSQWTFGNTQTTSVGSSVDSNGGGYGYFGRRAPINRTFSFGIQVTF